MFSIRKPDNSFSGYSYRDEQSKKVDLENHRTLHKEDALEVSFPDSTEDSHTCVFCILWIFRSMDIKGI